MDSSAFSLGIIFIGEDVNSANLLYHEYGHIVQLEEVGILLYVQYVALPSVACFWAREAGWLPKDMYYNLSWENIADRYGKASRKYHPGATDIADAYWGFVKNVAFVNDLLSP